MTEAVMSRQAAAVRGKHLEYFTIAWNVLEGLVGVAAGVMAGSISLVGFGADSFIEVASGTAMLWRMSAEMDEHRRERIEAITLRIVGICFLALAAYVGLEAASTLVEKRVPKESIPGIVLAAVSLLVMPVLARAKRRVASHLKSAAMRADARQTDFCMILSAILLSGLILNAAFGLWWADPLAGLAMVPIILKEGIDGLRGKACCGDVCH